MTWRRVGALVCAVVGPLTLVGGGRAGAQDGPPDLNALRALGQRAAARLEVAPASWTAFFAVGPEYLVFEVLQAPPARRRIDVHLERNGERAPVATILERDGRWYVADGDGSGGLYRPFEAPLRAPSMYAYLAAAMRPRTADQALDGSEGEHLGVEGGVATWRVDTPEAELRKFDALYKDMQRQVGEKPELRQDASFRERVRWLGRLENEFIEGALTKVDLATGIVVRHGPPGQRVAVAGFRWRDEVDQSQFDVSGEPPIDASGDPTLEAPQELVMFAHCGWWRPGVPLDQVELDARLLELPSRRVRRVPFRGATSLPGCFSLDRLKVYVSGRDGDGFGLFEVDLRTGKNRRLGGAALAVGECRSPALSPDGRSLAVWHRGPVGPGQVHLIDIEAGTARALGGALAAGALGWLPGGDGLLLVTRDGPGEPERIATLDLTGRLTALRRGSAPTLLPDGRVLFLEVDSRLWFTCDLTGADPRPFHDGLAGLSAPALSPDGRRAVFVDERPGLVMVDLTTGRRQPVDVPHGLFGTTSWR